MKTHQNEDPSDTDHAARKSVFAAEKRRNRSSRARVAQRPKAKTSAAANVETGSSTVPPPDAVEDREGRADEGPGSAPVTVEKAKGSFDLRRLLEEHPVAAAAAALGAIGVGVVGYRWVRHSLPVRLYLALRFGRFRELIRV